MFSTTKSRSTLPLLAASAWTLGLTGSVTAQQPADVRHKTVKVGDLDI